MFKKAERKQAKLKLALTGPTGSGKTWSALLIAKGLGKKIAVIDTENGSASLYADLFDFDVVSLSPPFTHDKYIQAIEAAEKGEYDVIIIDSSSHAWAGEGGTLDQKALLDMNPKSNQFANWKKPKENYTKFKNSFLHSNAHIICTLRSKMAYTPTEDRKIVKQGMEPIAEPGIEYEFSVVFDLQQNHYAQISKDRTTLFDGQSFIPTEETGKIILDWYNSAKPEEPKPIPWEIDVVLEKELYGLGELAGFHMDALEQRIRDSLKKEVRELTEKEYKFICEKLKKEANDKSIKAMLDNPGVSIIDREMLKNMSPIIQPHEIRTLDFED